MIVRLDTQRLQTLDQIREFLADSRPLDLQPQGGLSCTGTVRLRVLPGTTMEVDFGGRHRSLAEVDALHGTLSGPATRQLCIRALHVFGDAAVSNGHL